TCFIALSVAGRALASGTTPLLFPGGVVDEAGARAYIIDAQHDLDALDLATGRVLWTAPAMRPLAVVDGRLVAWSRVKPNAVRVVVLDERTGKPLVESEPIVFPEWVVIIPAERGG